VLPASGAALILPETKVAIWRIAPAV
jgi:hypothetical protein